MPAPRGSPGVAAVVKFAVSCNTRIFFGNAALKKIFDPIRNPQNAHNQLKLNINRLLMRPAFFI